MNKRLFETEYIPEDTLDLDVETLYYEENDDIDIPYESAMEA